MTTLFLEYHPKSFQQNFDIQPNAPIVDVKQIKFDNFIKILDFITPANLQLLIGPLWKIVHQTNFSRDHLIRLI